MSFPRQEREILFVLDAIFAILPCRFCATLVLHIHLQPPGLNLNPSNTMPRGSLLRHMFKHGRHARNKSETGAPLLSEPEMPAPVAEVGKVLPPIPTPPMTPDKHTVVILPESKEEPRTDKNISTASPPRSVPTISDTASIITVIATQPPAIDLSTITTRDIIYASIDEATEAMNTHLRTLGTTLALLEALDGFSPTVEVLLCEFREKKRQCEGKLEELKGFEEGVNGMLFADEIERGGGDGEARA